MQCTETKEGRVSSANKKTRAVIADDQIIAPAMSREGSELLRVKRRRGNESKDMRDAGQCRKRVQVKQQEGLEKKKRKLEKSSATKMVARKRFKEEDEAAVETSWLPLKDQENAAMDHRFPVFKEEEIIPARF